MTDTPADVLRRAADRVQFLGWTQGAPARSTKEYTCSPHSDRATRWCAYGALARESLSDHTTPIVAFGIFLGSSIAEWNDAEGRTAGEVADAMRRCAKELENA
jgi:hypothetical protein